jgi:hypothetical protein
VRFWHPLEQPRGPPALRQRRHGGADTAAALSFVRSLLLDQDHIPFIALENPVGIISTNIMPASQYIQPYQFGDDASKKTGLWTRNLPPLVLDPAERVAGRIVGWPRGSGKMVERWSNQTDSGQNKLGPSDDRWKLRAETYPGIARARFHPVGQSHQRSLRFNLKGATP